MEKSTAIGRRIVSMLSLAITSAFNGCANSASSVAPPSAGANLRAAIASPTSARAGSTIAVRVTLVNTSSTRAEVTLAGRNPDNLYFSLILLRSAKDTAATLFNRAVTLRISSTVSLEGGESVELSGDFPLVDGASRALIPGDYLLRARVIGIPNDWYSEARPLKILP